MSKYHYTESGLRNIWLASGYDVVQTCYGPGVAIHDVAGLHRAIGEALAEKKPSNGRGTQVSAQGNGHVTTHAR